MNQLLAHIEQYKKEITAIKISSKEDLESFRIKYLGTKGILKNVMGEMKNVPIDQKKEAGQLLNEFKLFVESNYEALANSMETTSVKDKSNLDITLPGQPLSVGSRHPISIVHNKIVQLPNT